MNGDSAELDALFAALADPARRRILELLSMRQPLTTNELAALFPVTRWAVMKHLETLRGARLVQTFPQGRRRLHFVNGAPFAGARAWLGRFE